MQMKVYHIYKTDCFRASRVMLQAGWDSVSNFLHLGRIGTINTESGKIDSRKLSILNLIKSMLSGRSREGRVLVFHAQSSLPYLILARFVALFLGRGRIFIVYDIHDLHEKSQYTNWWDRVRQGLIRYNILKFLEMIVCKDTSIRKMTVSVGLSKVIAREYRIPPPSVVRSVPSLGTLKAPDIHTIDKEISLLFFGSPERAPIELLETIAEAGFELHLYGLGIDEYELVKKGVDLHNSKARLFGPYSPDELGFLLNYNYLLLYAPSVQSLNFRYSLPNKLFQGMSAGLQFIVSDNFEEIIETLDKVPGAVEILTADKSIEEAVENLRSLRERNYPEKIMAYSYELNKAAELEYSRITSRSFVS